jgi:uncharacterized membrane protein YuzA (DUF378 family)
MVNHMNNTRSLWRNIALLLTIVGGLNWGLVGLFNFDLVAFIFGEMTMLTKAVYVVVALSSVVSLSCLKQEHKTN